MNFSAGKGHGQDSHPDAVDGWKPRKHVWKDCLKPHRIRFDSNTALLILYMRTSNELKPRPELMIAVRCRYQYSSIVHRASMIYGNERVMGAVVKVFVKTVIGEASGQKEFL
jgi:hypothetical protein